MQLTWRRHQNFKIIRRLLDERGKEWARIRRLGNYKYRIVFNQWHIELDDYVVEGELKTAKAVGMMLVRLHSTH